MSTETIEIVTNLIGSWGFPIACCIFLWKYINTTMTEFTKAMQENTKMLNRICDKLDIIGGESENDSK